MTIDLEDFRAGRNLVRAAFTKGLTPEDTNLAQILGVFADAVDYIDQLITERDEARTAATKVSECCGCSGGYYNGFPWEVKPSGD